MDKIITVRIDTVGKDGKGGSGFSFVTGRIHNKVTRRIFKLTFYGKFNLKFLKSLILNTFQRKSPDLIII